MKVAKARFEAEHKIAIPCDCIGTCEVLFASDWDDGDGEPAVQYFDFYSTCRTDYWRGRLRAAWAALRGKTPYYHGICATPDQARALGEWLLARTTGSE